MLKELIVLIWIPCSWKSTLVNNIIATHQDKNIHVVSSDKIRETLYDGLSMEEQYDHTEVFNQVKDNILEYIYDNKTDIILFDATNISKKHRQWVFELRKKYNQKKWCTLKVSAYDIFRNIEELKESCLIRNKERQSDKFLKQFHHAFLSEDVLENMFKYYIKPTYTEWFDEIKLFDNSDYTNKKSSLDTIFFVIKNINSSNIDDMWDNLCDNHLYMNKFNNFQQLSIYHVEDLDTHIKMILEAILTDYDNWLLSEREKELLVMIAIYHDIWKLYTRLTRAENLVNRWKVQDEKQPHIFYNKDGSEKVVENYLDYQFQMHEKVSGVIFEREFKDALIEYNILSKEEAEVMNSIILEHLNFHTLNYARDNKWVKALNKFYYSWKCTLYTTDKEVSFNKKFDINLIKNPTTLFEKFLNLWLKFSKYDNLWRIAK